jgi:hypothetical protein
VLEAPDGEFGREDSVPGMFDAVAVLPDGCQHSACFRPN